MGDAGCHAGHLPAAFRSQWPCAVRQPRARQLLRPVRVAAPEVETEDEEEEGEKLELRCVMTNRDSASSLAPC